MTRQRNSPICPSLLLIFSIMVVLVEIGCLGNLEHRINYGLNHYDMGLYNQAIPSLLSAASSLEGKNPPDPRLPQVLIALGDMASAEKGNNMAEDFYKKALIASEHLAAPNDTLLRNSLVHGGNYYLNQNRPIDALPLLKRAVSISERRTDWARNFYAIDLDNLAQAYYRQEQNTEGRALSLKALGVIESCPCSKGA